MAPMLSGYCMDIGGTRARLYHYRDGTCLRRLEIELPKVEPAISAEQNGMRRMEAVADLVQRFELGGEVRQIATACAGLKNAERTGVTALHFAVPLPRLAQVVEESTGVSIAPLYDDDVAAAWGHAVSPASPFGKGEANALLLTAGTGLAEAHWVGGRLVDKKTYPRASELGLETRLRAEGWRGDGDPSEAIAELVRARRALYPLQRVVLAGRFVHLREQIPRKMRDTLELEVDLVDLPEAPALGALYLLQASSS